MTWFQEMDLLWDWSDECVENDECEKAKAIIKARTHMIIKRMSYLEKLI